ncbi:MAG: metallophosphoesterase [Erysipelotrichia bacterium]|nr:metallophosphoesterase [Erysipelotrichia bacterium]NCC55271.1 metallophosphoesterase [Erysipelotrichia bacterium]
MKHKLLKILSILFILVCIIAGCLFYAIYISPDKLTTKYDTLISSKIPKTMDDVNIGYFSDVYYMSFMKDERLDKMIEVINSTDIDILLFGGDLFANAQSPNINAETIQNITTKLASLKAPLGKFYVLGEQDNMTPDTRTLVSNILYNAGFEDMNNRNIRVHNGTNESITLIGLENSINGNVDIQSAFNGVASESYRLLFTHTPDNAGLIESNSIDFGIAGHSLGGQIYIPIFGTLKKIDGAVSYMHGNYKINDFNFVVSNGLGTIDVDMRLFCPPQFNVLQLRKK